jgi:hypothetical protein
LQAPAASDAKVNELALPLTRLTLALVVSQTNVDTTFVAAASPTLQTRAPTRNVSGPEVVGMLLSSPMTFQVIGFGVSSTHVSPDGQSAASAHRVAVVRLQCPMAGGGMPLMVSDAAAYASDGNSVSVHPNAELRTCCDRPRVARIPPLL